MADDFQYPHAPENPDQPSRPTDTPSADQPPVNNGTASAVPPVAPQYQPYSSYPQPTQPQAPPSYPQAGQPSYTGNGYSNPPGTPGGPYGYPYTPSDAYPPAQPRKGMAIASLVLGIASIVLCCFSPYLFPLICAVVGLILGIVAAKQKQGGMAVAGIILSSIGLLLGVFILLVAIFSVQILAYIEEYYPEFYWEYRNNWNYEYHQDARIFGPVFRLLGMIRR